jgi:hypothetical protein
MEFDQILTTNNILPILHGIDMQTIRNSHPEEYQKIRKWMAITSDKGIDYIVKQAEIKINNLKSEKNIDYTRLRHLLAAKNWKEADQESYRVMKVAVGKKDGDYLTSDDLLNFPCTDLRTIDRLWVKYSNGHFGFSVQKEIYLSVGGKADGISNEEAFLAFIRLGHRVGWRWESNRIKYSEVTYDTYSPS